MTATGSGGFWSRENRLHREMNAELKRRLRRSEAEALAALLSVSLFAKGCAAASAPPVKAEIAPAEGAAGQRRDFFVQNA